MSRAANQYTAGIFPTAPISVQVHLQLQLSLEDDAALFNRLFSLTNSHM